MLHRDGQHAIIDTTNVNKNTTWFLEILRFSTFGSCEVKSSLLDHLSPSRKVREGLADVISMHEMLTNQILLFHIEIVATPWLQYVRSIYTVAVLRLQIKQAVNYEY